MRFRPFSLCCECGLTPARIKQVGLSADHQLVIHWWCLRCRRAIYVVKDLRVCLDERAADYAAEDRDGWSEIAVTTPDAADDERFLERMGIRFPAESDR